MSTHKSVSKLAVVVATVLAFSVTTAPTAGAVPVRKSSVADAIRTCLEDGYYAGHLQTVYSPVTGKTYHLDCGTPDSSSGLLHINAAHPIPTSTSGIEQFELCLQRLIGSGAPGGTAATGTTRWNWPNSSSWKVGGYTQNSTLAVNTVFTPGSNSANWASCAA